MNVDQIIKDSINDLISQELPFTCWDVTKISRKKCLKLNQKNFLNKIWHQDVRDIVYDSMKDVSDWIEVFHPHSKNVQKSSKTKKTNNSACLPCYINRQYSGNRVSVPKKIVNLLLNPSDGYIYIQKSSKKSLLLLTGERWPQHFLLGKRKPDRYGNIKLNKNMLKKCFIDTNNKKSIIFRIENNHVVVS